MPSFTAYSAAAVMALSGLASAMPSYSYSNGTSYNGTLAGAASATGSSGSAKASGTSAGAVSGHGSNSTSTSGSSNSTSKIDDSFFCPRLNGDIYIDGRDISYLIQCDKTHFGVQIEISISGNTKRATYTNLGDCIALCDATTGCVGTGFNTDLGTCTLYSDVEAEVASDDTDFAVLVNTGSGTTVSAGGVATSTLYSTNVVTISSCAPTVTNCPLRSAGANAAGVVTVLDAVTETTYQCPTATTLPASPVACTSCPYTASSATVYSATSVSGAGSSTVVPVSTVAVAIPMGTATTVSVTTCTACYAGTSTGSATVSASGAAVYTGAAGQVKAGMGLAAFVAGAAILI